MASGGTSTQNVTLVPPDVVIRRVALDQTVGPDRVRLMAAADGTWKIVVDSPMGNQDVTLTLRAEGGSLSGDADTPFGPQSFDGGTIDGDDLAWKVKTMKPMPMTIVFAAKVDGDEISGDVKLGPFGDASFKGTRV
jgi:hypothetical protein